MKAERVVANVCSTCSRRVSIVMGAGFMDAGVGVVVLLVLVGVIVAPEGFAPPLTPDPVRYLVRTSHAVSPIRLAPGPLSVAAATRAASVGWSVGGAVAWVRGGG